MRPATAEEKALAVQQPVLIGASIPVRSSAPELLDGSEV
jgi:nitrite reductase (NADH) large subunit